MRIRLFAIALAFAALLAAPGLNRARAASLIVSNGILQGADGVDVGGALYNVRFIDDSCAAVFNGCTSNADFDFQNDATASLAAQALLDQVLINGPAGQFDDSPYFINGCADPILCAVFIPTDLRANALNGFLAVNFNASIAIDDYANRGTTVSGNPALYDYRTSTAVVLGRFTPAAATVSEPSALMLLGGGLVLAGFARRRRR